MGAYSLIYASNNHQILSKRRTCIQYLNISEVFINN